MGQFVFNFGETFHICILMKSFWWAAQEMWKTFFSIVQGLWFFPMTIGYDTLVIGFHTTNHAVDMC